MLSVFQETTRVTRGEMQTKVPPLLTGIIILTAILAIPLTTHPVLASTGLVSFDPGNLFPVVGPLLTTRPNIEYVFYSDPTTELNAFASGQLDLSEGPLVSVSQWSSFDNNPDFVLSPAQPMFGAFGLIFNGASS